MLSFLHGEHDSICLETLFLEKKICKDNEVKKTYVFEKAASEINLLQNQFIKKPISGNNMK